MTGPAPLFVPGDDARKVARALAGEADAVIVDLEDSVAPERKEEAREVVRDRPCPRGAPLVFLRINSPLTGEGRRDLDFLPEFEVDGIVVPKASEQALGELRSARVPVLALIETAEGLSQAGEIAARPEVARLLLGTIDLALELGLSGTDSDPVIDHARIELVLASARAGIQPPLDGVHPRLDDDAGIRREAWIARGFGMGGKACIHPAQLATVQEIFSPTEEELTWARQVVEASREGRAMGRGTVVLDGAMVDLPVARRAERILAAADRQVAS